jgi:hypothetical protein
MVGGRYSAQGPRAFAVRGQGTFVSGVSETCLFAEFSAVLEDNARNRRTRIEGSCPVGAAKPDTVPALLGDRSGTSLALDDQRFALHTGRGELRRLPIGDDGAARRIRDTGCPTAVAEDDRLWRQPPQWVQARVQGEPRLRQGGCP